MSVTLTSNSQKVLDALPADGLAISGGKLKDRLQMSTLDLKAAKAELKKAGLVKLGRGRGGTVSRVEGVEAPKKMAPEEALVVAREVKKELTREQKATKALRDHVEAVGRKAHPEADEVKGLMHKNGKGWYVEVWKDGKAKIWGIPEELML